MTGQAVSWRRLLLLLLVSSLVVFAGPVLTTATADDTPESDGKRIYRDGILPSGRPIVAQLASGAQLAGRQAACVTCHRRSGLGAAEGQNIIRPLTVPGFFAGQENTRRYARPHAVSVHQLQYTDESFDRALHDGQSLDGRTLNPLMPRYALDSGAITALRAYLSSVALRPSPGVSDSEIHFATIIAPDSAPGTSQATLRVLGAMIEAHNAGTRSEKHRRRAGVESMHVDWRKWMLHVWELKGEADSWAGQLDRLYRDQPVFAVLSGAGVRWQPMHDFCEQHEIPCLFPNVDVPGRAEPGQYNLYLSRGVLVEADLMARHLAESGWNGTVWQLRRDEYRAEAGARAFHQAWQATGGGAVREVVLQPGGRIDAALAEIRTAGNAAAVLWLDAADLEQLARLGLPGGAPILSSGTLMGDPVPGLAHQLAERLLVIWPFAVPGSRDQRFDRVREWVAARGLASSDPRPQANTYLAATMAGDAIAHMGNNYSREYFIERIEHYADKSLATGAFPQIGLGPGQRFASKGAYVARLAGPSLIPVGEWTVP